MDLGKIEELLPPTGSYSNLRNLMRRLREAEFVDSGGRTRVTASLREALRRELARVVYGVRQAPMMVWEGEKVGLAPGVYYLDESGAAHTKRKSPHWRAIPVYTRPRMWSWADVEDGKVKWTEDPVCFVEVKAGSAERLNMELSRLSRYMAERGWQFLGIKSRGPNHFQTAVFLRGADFRSALTDFLGWDLGMEVYESDNLKYAQTMAIMLCRMGQKADDPTPIPLEGVIVEESDDFDGLMFALDKDTSDQLRERFPTVLTPKTKVLAGTLFNPWTKGVALLDQERNRVFTATVKLGEWREVLDVSRMLIHDTDTAQRMGRSREEIVFNGGEANGLSQLRELVGRRNVPLVRFSTTQELVYNYDPEEQKKIVEEIAVPEILRSCDMKDRSQARGVRALLYLGLKLDGPQIRRAMMSWAATALQGPPIEGIYRIVIPDTGLNDFEIKVPEGQGMEIGDKVAVTRFPALSVGNSTQIYTVVGYTNSNAVAVPRHPWMTVQGGDYDGDCARVSKQLYELFPDKKYALVKTKDIASPRVPRMGLKKTEGRIMQALAAFDRSIGMYDLMARRLHDLGRLGQFERTVLAKLVQAEVDAAKHNVRKPRIRISVPTFDEEGQRLIYPTDVIRNPFGNMEHWHVCKGTIYEEMLQAAMEAISQKLGDKIVDRGRLQEIARQIPEESSFSQEEYRNLISIGWDIARRAQEKFQHLSRMRMPDSEFQTAADKFLIEVELVSMEAADFPDTRSMKSHREDWIRRKREARMALLRCLAAKTNLRMLCRMVSLETLESLLSGAIVEPTKVCEGAQT
ncbi:MAG: hypothetical protein D6698_16520 [Gammaproteobacteria bacterium]|nr:MAG: hypothetical protein D6698_16520 [Gammaproteobacteria bacterium]